MNKKTIKIGLFLAIVTALAGATLAMVNKVTEPIIAEAAIAKEKENLIKIFPNVSDFRVVENYDDDSGLIIGVFKAIDAGMVFKVSVMGYAEEILYMVGIDNDAKIVGYEVLSFNDTPGIGDRILTAEFTDNVINKGTNDAIPILSGATKSSGAVVDGIKAVQTLFNNLSGIEDEDPGEAPAPSVTLGEPIGIYDSRFEKVPGEVVDVKEEADNLVYTVTSYGFYDEKVNHITVVLAKATGAVVEVSFAEFNDTVGIGDIAINDVFLDQFVGLVAGDEDASVDVTSGATATSISVARAVNAAMKAYKGR